MEKRLEAFEIFLHRSMLQILWVYRIRNEEVLCRIFKNTVFRAITTKKLQYYTMDIPRNEKYNVSASSIQKNQRKEI